MDVKERRWEIIQLICLDHDSGNWQAVLNMVMNLRVPKNGGGNYLLPVYLLVSEDDSSPWSY